MTRLDDIRQREQAATGGEWFNAGYEYVGSSSEEPDAEYAVCYVDKRRPGRGDELSAQGRANAEFIVHVRDDIPYLLDLVERAVPMVECKTFPNDHCSGLEWHQRRVEWLRDVRGEGPDK